MAAGEWVNMNIIGTGLSGLVGSRIVDLFAGKCEFQNLDLTTGVDITDPVQVNAAMEASPAEVVLHLAAFTNVNEASNQQGDTNGICYKVNVVGTEHIARAAKATGKLLIHLSTSFVFDGTKESMYVEEDAPNPIEWYGETKAIAEQKVQELAGAWTIFRIDQPFRSDIFDKRPDTTHALIDGLKKGTLYPQFIDHWFSPTIVEDLARALDWVINTKQTGIFHCTSGVKVSDYEYASMINRVLKIGAEVKKGSLEEYLKTAKRPYQKNTAMDASKLAKAAGLEWTKLEEAIKKIV